MTFVEYALREDKLFKDLQRFRRECNAKGYAETIHKLQDLMVSVSEEPKKTPRCSFSLDSYYSKPNLLKED